MGESQLKRLKASLRTAGITGQQKSKKRSSKAKQSSGGSSRLDRNVALQSIREEFNPFEIKTTREKYDINGRGRVKGAQGRPGLSKQIGEDNRKRTLLVEMQLRGKAGRIVDRRFGENDPTMTPEEKMLERFTKEKQKRVRGGDIFNLEDGDDDQLTHFGQTLGGDDFDAGNELMLSDDDKLKKRLKKRRLDPEVDEHGSTSDEEESHPERKKSKAEVMKEVIVKSKLHKYERQKVKEDDYDERERLDAQMTDIWALLGRQPTSGSNGLGTGANMEPVPGRGEPREKREEEDGKINPGSLAQMEGREDAQYDARVREMVYDKRSQPAERTKTAEEKVLEESNRLRRLEEARQRRMRGEEDSENERTAKEVNADEDFEFGDATKYGLGRGIPESVTQDRCLENPDELLEGDYEISEDGYIDVDEDGIIDGSGAEFSDDYDSDVSVSAGPDDEKDDKEENFLADILPGKRGPRSPVLDHSASDTKTNRLAFTFPCPQSHEEMLAITKDIPILDLPIVVQRIRVLHHPRLHAENKLKLAEFSSVLLEHILHIVNSNPVSPPFAPTETLLRHLHALSKSYPERVAEAFRAHLKDMHENRTDGDLTAGDLILFTAINNIFPTSDHFHQVVTPAMIVMCKWLGQVPPNSLARLGTGTYLATLCAQYQKLSRRFVPEAIGFVLQALSLLAPTAQGLFPGDFLYHEVAGLRIEKSKGWEARKMKFSDIFDIRSKQDTQSALVYTLLSLVEEFAGLWAGKKAFTEVFQPALQVIEHLGSKECKCKFSQDLKTKLKATKTTLTTALTRAVLSRRPLELHHHRPLPIKTYIPKFEESYSGDKRSYDHDKEREQLAKLKAEHKKERKGALRELRKDSSFMAREKLKADKKTSKEYHSKMARLTAMIQTEEGAAANEYKKQKKR